LRAKSDPSPESFNSRELKVIYEHILELYRIVGRLEGAQKVLVLLVVSALGVLIATAIRVFAD